MDRGRALKEKNQKHLGFGKVISVRQMPVPITNDDSLFCYNDLMKTYRYLISGRVQGVAFRHYTVREAEKWGVAGTVRNLWNGDVEVYAQGNDDSIGRFEQFLHIGPRSARVDKIDKEILDQDQIFQGFDISW